MGLGAEEVLLEHHQVEEEVEELQAQNDLEVEVEVGLQMRQSLEQEEVEVEVGSLMRQSLAQVEVGAEVLQGPRILLQGEAEVVQGAQSDREVVVEALVVVLRLSLETQVLCEVEGVEQEWQLQEWMVQGEVPAAGAGKWELELVAEGEGQMVHLYWELWAEDGEVQLGSLYEAAAAEGRQEWGFCLEVRVEQRPCARQ